MGSSYVYLLTPSSIYDSHRAIDGWDSTILGPLSSLLFVRLVY